MYGSPRERARKRGKRGVSPVREGARRRRPADTSREEVYLGVGQHTFGLGKDLHLKKGPLFPKEGLGNVWEFNPALIGSNPKGGWRT